MSWMSASSGAHALSSYTLLLLQLLDHLESFIVCEISQEGLQRDLWIKVCDSCATSLQTPPNRQNEKVCLKIIELRNI